MKSRARVWKPNSVAAGLAALALCLAARADITLAPLFRDGAVLQRDKPLPVWGWGEPGEKVQVQWAGQTAGAVAGPDGRWQATLPPQKASAQPAELVAAGHNTLRVEDVLVGDVWLCSGQSNMEFVVAGPPGSVFRVQNAEAEIADARYPSIRQFKIPHTIADQPARDVVGEWKACTPENVKSFSAVAYFFARELWRKNGVPIGLVNSSWGGTQIESWMSEAALAKDPAHAEIAQRWATVLQQYPAKVAAHEKALAKWTADVAAAKASGEVFTRRKPIAPEGPGSRWQPAGMYHGMISPLIPAALSGVIWYQGEANGARAGEYRTLFPEMIQQWRDDFGQGNLPFYFVQLANFGRAVDKGDRQWAFLREAQAGALRLPATGMAVTIDIGDPANIHPKNKQEVGRRLGLIARAQLFGENVESLGPTYAGVTREGGALRVRFDHAAGLSAAAGPLTAFEIAGADENFVPATARLDGETVLASADAVADPVAVRYAWKNSPIAGLKNGAGLPAAPFRSDDWSEHPEIPARPSP